MIAGLNDLLVAFTNLQIPWMIGGSIGAMCYSEPRATLDVDCILDLKPGSEKQVMSAFPEQDFYLPPQTVIAHEIRRGALGSFNIIHHASGFKADCYPCGNDDLMRWGLAKAQPLPIAGITVPVAPPEYIVCMKLRYFAISGQEKHLRDIHSIVRLTPHVDKTIISEWATRYGVSNAWELVLDN